MANMKTSKRKRASEARPNVNKLLSVRLSAFVVAFNDEFVGEPSGVLDDSNDEVVTFVDDAVASEDIFFDEPWSLCLPSLIY